MPISKKTVVASLLFVFVACCDGDYEAFFPDHIKTENFVCHATFDSSGTAYHKESVEGYPIWRAWYTCSAPGLRQWDEVYMATFAPELPDFVIDKHYAGIRNLVRSGKCAVSFDSSYGADPTYKGKHRMEMDEIRSKLVSLAMTFHPCKP